MLFPLKIPRELKIYLFLRIIVLLWNFGSYLNSFEIYPCLFVFYLNLSSLIES